MLRLPIRLRASTFRYTWPSRYPGCRDRAVHTAPCHRPDDYAIGSKYGLETANPVGPDGTYLPGTYPRRML
ncbi:hypothetical protein ACLK17_00185 [Escherichia coli]